MPERRRRRERARADRILAGLWRLRLPLPWPAVPHVNAFAIAAGDGVVLVDCGLHQPGGLAQLERALNQAGLRLEHVRLLVCTHAHIDHYGLAAAVIDVSQCELWMHPAHAHATVAATDPAARLKRRIEIALQSGVPASALERYRGQHGDDDTGVARVVLPDRDLLPGVEVETDLGSWQVYETPGHAPSHVVLHQPDRRLLLSGDHLLGRVSLFFDYDHTPDPVGEFMGSLDTVSDLDVDLILAGHGRPVRDAPGLIAANRREVKCGLRRVRSALAEGPRTAYEIAAGLLGVEELNEMQVGWGLSVALSYLDHLELRGDVRRITAEGALDRWVSA